MIIVRTGDCFFFEGTQNVSLLSKLMYLKYNKGYEHVGIVGKVYEDGSFDFYESHFFNHKYTFSKNPIAFLQGTTSKVNYTLNSLIDRCTKTHKNLYLGKIKFKLREEQNDVLIKDLEFQVNRNTKYSILKAIISPFNQILPLWLQKLLSLKTPFKFCSLLAYIALYKAHVISAAEYNKDLLTDPVELSRLSCFHKLQQIDLEGNE